MITEDIDKLEASASPLGYLFRAAGTVLDPDAGDAKGAVETASARWAQGGRGLVNLRKMARWEHHRMWPLFLEYALSTLWAFAHGATVVLFILSHIIPLPANLAVASLFPRRLPGCCWA